MPENENPYPNQPEFAADKRALRERSMELAIEAYRVAANSGKTVLTLAEDIYEYVTKDGEQA